VSHPWLSVLMPTFNGAAYLAAALDSIRCQGDQDIEILVADDGSTDDTLAILHAFAGKLPLRILRRASGRNWVAGVNEALAEARGDYVCLLHQDDTWLPGRLHSLRRLAVARPEAVLLAHATWFIDSKGERLGLWCCPLPAGRRLPPAMVVERLLVQNFLAAPAPLFRREAALAAGGLDPELWYAGDWDLWLKLAAAGPAVYCPRPLASLRIHPFSQTVLRSGQRDDIRRQLREVFARHFAAWSAPAAIKAEVRRAAEFARELNVWLFSCLSGSPAGCLSLVRRCAALGPAAWHRFFRDSRIVERLRARLRADLRPSCPCPAGVSLSAKRDGP
jgi:glycosyltransferase involved in cell wall biosynthesis